MLEINLNKEPEKNNFSNLRKIIIVFLLFSTTAFFLGLGIGFARHLINKRDAIPKEKVIENLPKENNISMIFKDVSQSVVSITSTEVFSNFLVDNYSRTSQGSGVIVDDTGEQLTIITNYHVVKDTAKILVILDEEIDVTGSLLGYDEDSDLAFVSVKKENIPQSILVELKQATLGDSEKLKVGEKVLAIGSPLGYKNTVTDGIVSGLQRNLNFPDRKLKLIQTNAAINPGNSGGALVNMSGEVIGINTVKIVGTQLEGLAFAIPINNVKEIYEEILDKGYVSRPFLGIIGSNLVNEANGISESGVLVRGIIEDSAAREAGILEEDIIIEFNNKEINNMEDLIEGIEETKVGDDILVILIREENKKMEFKVIMQERK